MFIIHFLFREVLAPSCECGTVVQSHGSSLFLQGSVGIRNTGAGMKSFGCLGGFAEHVRSTTLAW